ncbi:DUF5815 family protein [Halorarius litoreus]|uniref:DUF5815 family protein n=1 Tax=Halorarius litoreus TaxID=2962676 RepID=UPI0020CC62DB|nr:DUF5815 family protein [Halorarius litoreus]
MPEPRVPGGRGEQLELPCGETKSTHDLDMGMREFACDCGERHAVVVDVHPLSRFVPEFLVDTLRATVDTADDSPEFSTTHLMGIVLEEFPEKVVGADTSDDGVVGYAMVWVSEFDSRRLHEIAVELIVELMEHAISHAESDDAMSQFEEQMLQFDVSAFVEEYRRERDFETEHDTPA